MSPTPPRPPVPEPRPVASDGPTILDHWKAVVAAVPDHEAFESSDAHYTFAEADHASDVLAAGITASLPAEPGSLLAAFLGQSATDLVTFLAILKAGRVAVCLDGHLPAARLQRIVDLAGVGACIVSNEQREAYAERNLALRSATVATVRANGRDAGGSGAPARPTAPRNAADPVAIAYTSGSTGEPKGVVQTQGMLLSEALMHRRVLSVGPEDRAALALPIGFAACLSVMFGAMLNGALLSCVDPRVHGVHELIRRIDERRLTTLHCTPHLARAVADALGDDVILSSLRMVTTVGEAVHGRDVEALRRHLAPTATFSNWLGSSETGGIAVHTISGEGELPPGLVPAGTPVPHKQIVLRDETGAEIVDGSLGEVCVVSHFLSGGYWHDDEQTARRFETLPDGRRLCRQGDLGRFDEHGVLHLSGRLDSAVKIRGYLVEPSEIEAALLTIDAVGEAAVTADTTDTGTRLVAYLTPLGGARLPSAGEVRRALRRVLPEYMVPTTIMALAELPRNDNGKIDRMRLPKILPDERRHDAPREDMNPVESELSALWAELLGLAHVGLDDDFMALGGDSLAVEELLFTVQGRFGVELPSTRLLESPTLREFARQVQESSEGTATPLDSDLVALATGRGSPVFCFAGAGGLALVFLPLARRLPEHDVYAFQEHGLEHRAIPDWSVEAAGRRFLASIRRIQPHGPYLLVGFSFGGLLALEVARRLREAGEEVRLVGLLDTFLPRSGAREREAARLASGTPERLGARIVRNLRRPLDAVLPDGLPGRHQVGRRIRGYLAGIVQFSGQRQFDAFTDHGTIVARRYRVAPYEGSAFVLLAETPDPTDTWMSLLCGRLYLLQIDSEHTAFLREPLVAKVAEAFREAVAASARETAGGVTASS